MFVISVHFIRTYVFTLLIIDCSMHGVELTGESSGDEVLMSSRARIILSRLAVVIAILLLSGILVAVRVFVHIDVKTDGTEASILAITNVTHPPSVNYTTYYPNSTLLVLPHNDAVPVISNSPRSQPLRR